jgi:hypothetical protein
MHALRTGTYVELGGGNVGWSNAGAFDARTTMHGDSIDGFLQFSRLVFDAVIGVSGVQTSNCR